MQLRLKLEEENLAEWLVDITSEAERQGSDKFVAGYNRCSLLYSSWQPLQPDARENDFTSVCMPM